MCESNCFFFFLVSEFSVCRRETKQSTGTPKSTTARSRLEQMCSRHGIKFHNQVKKFHVHDCTHVGVVISSGMEDGH